MARRIGPLIAAAMLVLAWSMPAAATRATAFPESIPIPDGFYPEGIAVDRGHDFYVGSLLDGAVYKGNLRSGDGSVLAPGTEGRVLAGLFFDERSGLVWAVGADGGTAKAFGFDGEDGALLAEVEIPGAFLTSVFPNDIVVTRDAAYVTDSLADVLWTFPLNGQGLPAGPPVALALSGDFTFVGPDDVPPGAFPVNLNGIDATPNGETLLANHTTLGVIYRIDPDTGIALEVDLNGGSVPSGDGMVLHGKKLYVVQNFLNRVAVVELEPGFSSGEITRSITSGLFRVPTTAARFGNSLYLVNARFDDAFPPIFGAPPVVLDYDVVAVRR